MTFQQLSYLLEVYRTGSIKQAANQLFVSASSVSIAVSNLEKELGYPIFFRTQKGLALTAGGRKVIEHAHRICESYKQLSGIDYETHTTLRIGSLDYIPCTNAFTHLVNENRNRTDISFSLINSSASVMINKVADFELDIGIIASFEPRFLALKANLKRKKLSWKLLETVPCVITIGSGHRLYHEKHIRTSDMENDLLIDNSSLVISNNKFLKGIINIPSEKVMTVDNQNTRIHLLRKGVGYTIGRMHSADIISQCNLRCIPIDNINYQLICITNPMHILPREGYRFLDYLDEEIIKPEA